MNLLTSVPRLDEALELLSKFLEKQGNKLVLPQGSSLSSSELRKVIPGPALEAAFMLYEGKWFEQLKRIVPKKRVTEIESLRAKVSEQLGDLLKDKRVSDVMRSRFKDLEASVGEQNKRLNVPDSISAIPFFQPNGALFSPGVRLFISNDYGTLADLTLDWDDMTFLVESISEAMRDNAIVSERFIASKEIDISEELKKRITSRLDGTIAACEKVKAIIKTIKTTD